MKPLESFIPSSVAEAMGSTLMHSLWQLSALVLILTVLLLLVPTQAARLRYWMAVSTMGLMLLMPIGTFAYLYSPEPATGVAPIEMAAMDFSSTPVAVPASFSPQVRPPMAAVETGSFFDVVTAFFQDNAYIFLSVWMVGVLLFSLRFLGGCWQVHRLRNRNIQAVPTELMSRFSLLLMQVGIRRTVSLRLSTAIDTPMVMGALKPVILLPVGLLTGMSMEQVECILIHELAHVRRWDYLVNILQSVAEIVLFFHPAAWWVTGIIRKERENCCDEWVVKLNSNKVEYARALLNLEILRQQQPAMAMAAQGGDLKNRILRITGGVIPRERRFHARGLVYGLIMLVFITLAATQGDTVVKAALPFFTEDQTQCDDAGMQDSDQIPVTMASVVSNNGNAYVLPVSNLMANNALFQILTTALDSPITKIILNDNGEEVIVNFSKGGEVVSATKNGKQVPKADLERYQGMAEDFFQGGNIPPIPPMPSLDPLPPLPPMPMIPPISPMPSLPPLPPMGDLSQPAENEKYQMDMEAYGKQMEEWGENFAKQFESQAWEDYGKEMGRWAENLSLLQTEESEEMKEVRKELERAQGELERAKNDSEREELEREVEELGERLGELHGEMWERNMGDFEEKMEEWSEKFEADMERFAEKQEEMAEEMGRRSEEEAERQAEMAEREAERDAERATRGSNAIGEALERDGLIDDANSYKFRINEKELQVNGKKQPDHFHRKYAELVEAHFNTELSKDWISIHHNVK